MADLRITDLHKRYGGVHAVKGVDLEIPAGEFTVLVGPSGCGKSTLLRTIAGLEDADAGTIEIGGRVVNDVRPRDRDIAMVFQNYALYPYLTVYENIAFGLRARKTPEPEIKTRVARAAEMLAIGPLLQRLPRQLSGGQRQRVAIGRAIVRDARMFLFDEPLSNLDAQLRDEMRSEIKRLHRDIGKTMIYVTHDQIEAMTLADRIVLLKDGRIEQQGTPLDLFERPATRFVASFLGSPQMNFLPVTMIADGVGSRLDINGTSLDWPVARAAEAASARGRALELGLRPEHMRRGHGPLAAGETRLSVRVDLVQPTGSRTYVTINIGGHPVVAELAAHDVQQSGEPLELTLDMNRAILIDPASGSVLTHEHQTRIGAATMPGTEPSRAIKLFGTEEPVTPRRRLSAGGITAELDNGALRTIRAGGVEVIRAIAFLVRDENWGTFAPELSELDIKEGLGWFEIAYRGRCADASRALDYTARIRCSDRRLGFTVDATPGSDFLTNRTGFIVLHPLNGVAGQPLSVEKVDRSVVNSSFPAIIDPDCPFRDVRALTHEVMPGLTVTCRMEGDTFEMEDHRNWMDASFKTYVRPLAQPWPYTLAKGQTFQQAVTLDFQGTIPASGSSDSQGAVTVTLATGDAAGTMPRIGLGLPAAQAAASLAASALIGKARPQVLVIQLDGRRGDLLETATTAAALVKQIGADPVLEIILPGISDPSTELAPIAAAVVTAGLAATTVTISPAAHMKAVLPGSKGPAAPSFEAMAAAARAAFPGARIGGGTYAYFTELNRIRPPAGVFDFLTHTSSPIVHAADDVSVMETLESLPAIIRSTRAFAGLTPYRVGPTAIAARDNPYGKSTAANPNNGRVCLAEMDPRHRGLFGAAWTLGYCAAMAAGGIEVVSLAAPTGPTGLIADAGRPYFDGLAGHGLYPVFHVVKGLAEAAGNPRLDASASDPSRLAVLAYRQGTTPTLWLANLTDRTQPIELPAPPRQLAMIDEASFVAAATAPDFLATSNHSAAALQPGTTLQLGAYAIARLTLDD